jgi:hypothetical protein
VADCQVHLGIATASVHTRRRAYVEAGGRRSGGAVDPCDRPLERIRIRRENLVPSCSGSEVEGGERDSLGRKIGGVCVDRGAHRRDKREDEWERSEGEGETGVGPLDTGSGSS